MKYIRTKDSIELIRGENHITNTVSYYNSRGRLSSAKVDDSKITNTIEELCDVLVSVRDNWHDVWNDFEDCKILCSESEIYGAIWTDKGLIYAAKYENNEWRLL